MHRSVSVCAFAGTAMAMAMALGCGSGARGSAAAGPPRAEAKPEPAVDAKQMLAARPKLDGAAKLDRAKAKPNTLPPPRQTPEPTLKPPPAAPTKAPASKKPARPVVPGQTPLTVAEAERVALRTLQILNELARELLLSGADCKRAAAQMHTWLNSYGAELRVLLRRGKGFARSGPMKNHADRLQKAMQPLIEVMRSCGSTTEVRAAIERIGKMLQVK